MLHHLLVVLRWTLELSAITIASLIVIAWTLATIRAVINHHTPTTPWVVGDVADAMRRAANEAWWHRALVALDVFLNVVVLLGNQGETMSSHAWRCSNKWWGYCMNYWLSWFQPNHGPKAASGDLERATAIKGVLEQALSIHV